MPYVRCPVCNDLFHLAVRGPSREEWEREHVRERDANGIPLLKCIRCWVELRPGHRVTIRAVPGDLASVLEVGQEGIVEAVEGDGLFVRFGGTLGAFRRDMLFYIPGQPSPPALPDSAARD